MIFHVTFEVEIIGIPPPPRYTSGDMAGLAIGMVFGGLLLAGVRNVSRTALGTLFGYAGGREVGADRHDLV